MKKTIYRLMLCSFCIVLTFTIFCNYITACDSHIIECNQFNCGKCLNIQNAKEILETLFCGTCLIYIAKHIELILKMVTISRNIIDFDVLLLKVQLNE